MTTRFFIAIVASACALHGVPAARAVAGARQFHPQPAAEGRSRSERLRVARGQIHPAAARRKILRDGQGRGTQSLRQGRRRNARHRRQELERGDQDPGAALQAPRHRPLPRPQRTARPLRRHVALEKRHHARRRQGPDPRPPGERDFARRHPARLAGEKIHRPAAAVAGHPRRSPGHGAPRAPWTDFRRKPSPRPSPRPASAPPPWNSRPRSRRAPIRPKPGKRRKWHWLP